MAHCLRHAFQTVISSRYHRIGECYSHMAPFFKVFCTFVVVFAVWGHAAGVAWAQETSASGRAESKTGLKTLSPLVGQTTGAVTGLAVPRFVSLRSDKVHVRSGPGTRYPIRWVYLRKNLPVEVVQEFETWRKIRDNEGQEGWLHQSLIAGRRYALITGTEPVTAYRKPDIDTAVVYRMEPGVVARVDECTNKWCLLVSSGFEGWVEKKSIWGIYPSEGIN